MANIMALAITIGLSILAQDAVAKSQPLYEYINRDTIPELEYMNQSVDPCDNFYEYTCGNFKNVKPMPDNTHIWDHFTMLQAEIHQLMKVILESQRQASDPKALQKAKAAYTSCVDTDYADRLRLPQKNVMDELGIWPLLMDRLYYVPELTIYQVGDIVAQYGVPLFFNYQILPNYYNSTENMIYIYKDALSNPQTFYGKLDKNFDDYLDAKIPAPQEVKGRKGGEETTLLPFEQFLRTIAYHLRDVMGTHRSKSDINADIEETINLMRVLQNGGVFDGEMSTTSTLTTVGQLQKWTDEQFGNDSIDWLQYLTNLFAPTNVQITNDMKVMHTANLTYGVLKLYRQATDRMLWNFVMVRLFTYMAPDSDAVMREAFDVYYKNQNWDVFPRWQYCLRKVLGYPDKVEYSMALTYEYQRYHFNVNKLSAAAELIGDLQNAFRDTLTQTDWMDDETEEQALSKLEEMITLLGYPEFTEDAELLDEYYDNLRVCTWEHFGNSQRARSFSQMLNFQQIGAPRDREIWAISPLEVNAFYNRANNRILFPASILNGVFFSGSISALDYSRIGAIIGHEITHGYDNEGRRYNKIGTLSNWWSTATEESFNEKTDCFLEQYSKYFIEEIGLYVNASKTLNENLADNGGLRQAYRALQKLQDRSTSIKTVQDLTPEQLFFIGYGTMWCMSESEYYLQQMQANNVYAPGRFRVNGVVSNMQEFADAFRCPVGSNMNPEKKCVLW